MGTDRIFLRVSSDRGYCWTSTASLVRMRKSCLRYTIDGTYMEFMDNGTPAADWPEILERELIEFKSHEGAEYFAKQH
ncbi:hypothetical protein [Klebsiella phage vB_KshKPC-M]|nr:hypothetical protein [Klebsiella phage vB_KshKPC-M]